MTHLSNCTICMAAVAITDRCAAGIAEAAASYRRMALDASKPDALEYRKQAARLEKAAASRAGVSHTYGF
ncbi:MAG: hypothetical protein Q8N51_00575 [Gammaproteobacteria bacterium]|nr:hypothetical protein [Gammaproteobacteria bacterium]